MRRTSTKLVLVGAPGVEVAELGLAVARAIRRPFFEPAGVASGSAREWFDCILATSGPAVVAVDWSIGRRVLDVRTDDHWIVFADSATDDPARSGSQVSKLRERADVSLDATRQPDVDVIDDISRAWTQRLTDRDRPTQHGPDGGSA